MVLWGNGMNLKDFFKIEDVEFTDEELELPYETYGVDKPEQIWYNIGTEAQLYHSYTISLVAEQQSPKLLAVVRFHHGVLNLRLTMTV